MNHKTNRKRTRISLAPIQETASKRIKEFDMWRVCQENQYLAKKNSQLRMNVRKLMEQRTETGHRIEKNRLVVINLVSRFEEIQREVEKSSEITQLVDDMGVKMNLNGNENVNAALSHNTALLMNDGGENKENQDPSRSVLKPIHQTKSYIPRIADCSIYGFDD